MILKLSLDLPEDAAYIRTTRLLSRCLLEDIKVTAPIINDVENIVGELCSNVIRHAKSKAMRFLVTLEYYEPKVVITVKDTGSGFVMNDVAPVGSSRSDGEGDVRVGGFGLSILDNLSDKLDYTETDPHGTTVRIEKDLHYETQRDADKATVRDSDKGGQVTASKD
jgi:anti-sigma regulatory factor (Ser/Thr protein kinase)